jgi:hypothetical protein
MNLDDHFVSLPRIQERANGVTENRDSDDEMPLSSIRARNPVCYVHWLAHVGPFGCFSPVSMLMLSCLMGRIWPLHKIVADQDWMRSCSETDQNSYQPQPTHTSGKGSILQPGINSQRQRLERRKKRMPTGRHNLG